MTKHVLFALFAVTLAVSSTGCCCIDRLFCGGCRGTCGYGHEGPGCSSCGGGGCPSCGSYGQSGGSSAQGMVQQRRGPSAQSMAKRHPAGGHPLVHQRRDADGEYEFAAGPPTGGTTYPYYTNRGPRDFLARNPRSIGP